MSIWLTIPSARPPEQANPVLQAWKDQGYKISLWIDPQELEPCARVFDRCYQGLYRGYAHAINSIIWAVILYDPSAEWFVIGGDDVLPDPKKTAEEIAKECGVHFAGIDYDMARRGYPLSTLGVMQPTGDRFAGGQIDRICGSAWIGREFAKRVNQGKGPLWPEYTHMFVDEELQEVALKHGVLWQRPDLVQLHRHYQRKSDAIDSPAVDRPAPGHITHDGYTPEHWEKFQGLFLKRKAEGFPGSELL